MSYALTFVAGAVFGYGTLIALTLVMMWRNGAKGERVVRVQHGTGATQPNPMYVEDSPGHFKAIGKITPTKAPAARPVPPNPVERPSAVVASEGLTEAEIEAFATEVDRFCQPVQGQALPDDEFTRLLKSDVEQYEADLESFE